MGGTEEYGESDENPGEERQRRFAGEKTRETEILRGEIERSEKQSSVGSGIGGKGGRWKPRKVISGSALRARKKKTQTGAQWSGSEGNRSARRGGLKKKPTVNKSGEGETRKSVCVGNEEQSRPCGRGKTRKEMGHAGVKRLAATTGKWK